MATTYKFDDSAPVRPRGGRHRRHPSNNSENDDNDPTDGNGSLTYSAASSINSAAGESTDSSLAGIMRVLDVQDSKELAHVLEKERARKHAKEDRSVAAESQNSLAYSTDGGSAMASLYTENTLQGTKLLAGQTSAQYEYDGGNYPRAVTGGNGGGVAGGAHQPHQHEGGGRQQSHQPKGVNPQDESIPIAMFEEAEHADSMDKRRKDHRKRRESRKQTENQTPKVKNSKKSSPPSSSPMEEAAPSPRQSRGMARSPPINSRPPKGRGGENMEMHEEDDVWYAKWWMFCFPDTVKTMTPKR